MSMSPSVYVTEMRRLETMRNEARYLHDAAAVSAVARRAAELNAAFWRPLLKRA